MMQYTRRRTLVIRCHGLASRPKRSSLNTSRNPVIVIQVNGVFLKVAEHLAQIQSCSRSIRGNRSITIDIPTINVTINQRIATIPWVELEVNLPAIYDSVTLLGLAQCLSGVTYPAIVISVVVKWIRSQPAIITRGPCFLCFAGVDKVRDFSRTSQAVKFGHPILRCTIQILLCVGVEFVWFDSTIPINVKSISATKRQITTTVTIDLSIATVEGIKGHAIPNIGDIDVTGL